MASVNKKILNKFANNIFLKINSHMIQIHKSRIKIYRCLMHDEHLSCRIRQKQR